MKLVVTISVPSQGSENFIEVEEKNPYKAVEALKSKRVSKKSSNTFGNQRISEIVPIHNETGVRDEEQISQMIGEIKKGKHLFDGEGFPNVKLVVSPNGELLLFDGHHSMLAYFLQGRRYLSQVPYIVVSGQDFQALSPAELVYFFPAEKSKVVLDDWYGYTVNWQAIPEKQLEKRSVKSIEELADKFGKRNKPPSQ